MLVVDLDEVAIDSTVDEIAGAGGEAAGYRADVTDEAAVMAMVHQAVDRWGRLDIAHNNAGINDRSQPFHELDLADWNRMIAVNLTSVFLSMKHEIAQMLAQGGGAIVNTSSGAGLVAAPGLPHYTAAKHGVLGLTKAAAQELNGSSIRVNAVLPGMTDTPMIRQWLAENPEIAGVVQSMMPGGKLGLAEEVAEAVVWLCSDHASWVSGESMVVDGGGICR